MYYASENDNLPCITTTKRSAVKSTVMKTRFSTRAAGPD